MRTYFKAGYYIERIKGLDYSKKEIEKINIQEGNRVFVNFSEKDRGKSRILVFRFSEAFISLFKTREEFIEIRDKMIDNLNRSYTPNEMSKITGKNWKGYIYD